jgi:hypothetical protein
MAKSALKEVGGIKGAVQRSGTWLLDTATQARSIGFEYLKWGVKIGGTVSFALATTSMIVLMPLLFEISREGQVRASSFVLVVLPGVQTLSSEGNAVGNNAFRASRNVEPFLTLHTVSYVMNVFNYDYSMKSRSWRQNGPKSRT